MTGGVVLRFDDYVERCLYHPTSGFYTSGAGAAGRRRDFLTSPEVGPLFGAVLARALDQWWDDAGRPSPFVVVDAGSGPGTLIRSLLLAAPRCARSWQLVSVERSPALRRGQDDLVERGVTVTAELPPLRGAVVIANELLDNLPFRVLERVGHGWVDLAVADPDGERVLTTLPTGDGEVARASALVPRAAEGARIPWLAGAARWVGDVLAAGPAHLLVLDYGCATTAELADRDWTEWVRTYRQHRAGAGPLALPGEVDLTVEIAADQLPPGAEWSTQAELLRRWGIDELVAEGRRVWDERAAVGDLAALRARSRVREAEALTEPGGLGSWLVGHWSSASPDRAHDGSGSVPG